MTGYRKDTGTKSKECLGDEHFLPLAIGYLLELRAYGFPLDAGFKVKLPIEQREDQSHSPTEETSFGDVELILARGDPDATVVDT